MNKIAETEFIIASMFFVLAVVFGIFLKEGEKLNYSCLIVEIIISLVSIVLFIGAIKDLDKPIRLKK